VRLGQRVLGVERRGSGWRVATDDGASLDADHVIVTAEGHATGRLLRYVDPALATLLGEIAYASSATITLGYHRGDIPHALDGFGFVVPRTEGRAVLACTFSSVKYPGRAPEGGALLRVFLGGAMNEGVLEGDDETLVRVARGELAELLGVQVPPLWTRVGRYPRAMPQYQIEHLVRVEAIEGCVRELPGLALAGGAYRGVGIADCVRSGEDAAARLLETSTSSRG